MCRCNGRNCSTIFGVSCKADQQNSKERYGFYRWKKKRRKHVRKRKADREKGTIAISKNGMADLMSQTEKGGKKESRLQTAAKRPMEKKKEKPPSKAVAPRDRIRRGIRNIPTESATKIRIKIRIRIRIIVPATGRTITAEDSITAEISLPNGKAISASSPKTIFKTERRARYCFAPNGMPKEKPPISSRPRAVRISTALPPCCPTDSRTIL